MQQNNFVGVAEVLRRYGPKYVKRFGSRMPVDHHKVLAVLSACRTFQLGAVEYQCTSCDRTHVMGRSCGNRHCATCQQDKGKAWLESQTRRLLPCPYFLVTFTVPAELRSFIRAHPRVGYEALFAASSAAMKELASNSRHFDSNRLGFTGVLHTWGRSLEYHPHVHYIVPCGALNQAGNAWKPGRVDFFLPVRALSILFREMFRAELRKAKLLDKVPASVWETAWVVNSKPVGDGRRSLKYLAPYVFRVAITDRRVLACEDTEDGEGKVTFLHKRSGTDRYRPMTVTAIEFIRRFLQHVLPSRFVKVRHYGFLAAATPTRLDRVRWLITLANLTTFSLVAIEKPVLNDNNTKSAIRCAACGSRVVVRVHYPPRYRDTG